LYWFNSATGPVPAYGPVNINVSAPGYADFSQPTLVHYDDNPNASLANLSSFWEVQSFVLAPSGPTGPSADLALTDVFPDNQPSGTLWARITNNGPGSLVGASVQLQCSALRYNISTCGTDGLGPLNVEVLYSADPGQTVATNSGMGLDTSAFWYNVVCGIWPSNGSYTDPDGANDYLQEDIPAPTGDLVLEDVFLGANNEVLIRVAASGPVADKLFTWTLNIGGSEIRLTRTAVLGSKVFSSDQFVSGTQAVKASIYSCGAPETNLFNNTMVKTCSSASHGCW
jgi:hypothetical protein